MHLSPKWIISYNYFSKIKVWCFLPILYSKNWGVPSIILWRLACWLWIKLLPPSYSPSSLGFKAVQQSQQEHWWENIGPCLIDPFISSCSLPTPSLYNVVQCTACIITCHINLVWTSWISGTKASKPQNSLEPFWGQRQNLWEGKLTKPFAHYQKSHDQGTHPRPCFQNSL